jgi:hypothetical protein
METTTMSFVPDTSKIGWKYLIMKISPKQRRAFQVAPNVTHQRVGFVRIGKKWRIGSKENLTRKEYDAKYKRLEKILS